MVYGKTQTSFRLLTEETAIKWRLPVNGAGPSSATTAGGGIYAGMVVYLNGTLEYAIDIPISATVAGLLCGVAMDDYNSSLDETQGSGFITVVIGPHIGCTSNADNLSSVKVGAKIYIPYTTIGKMDTVATATTVCANALACDAAFLTYWWRNISA